MKKAVRPLRNEADYDWALAEVAHYFDRPPARGSLEADRFDLLATVIEAYEAKHWPIEPADPIDAIRYRMETAGYTQADLARLLGSRPRASEIMSRKRALTIPMAYKLHREWNIPAETLIRPYHLSR
jgi:HTH-type transcriptional regulator / antitoxin HigA